MDVNWLNADYLPWLIMGFPLVSFLVITLATLRHIVLSQIIALFGIGMSWLLSMVLFVKVVWQNDATLGDKVYGSSLEWLDVGASTFRMGVAVDPLTTYMLLMVPLAALMIFIYSAGYMRGDAHNARFFAYLSLFAGAMLTLTVADNLLMLFIGWEVMGFCSYSLIGFWFHKKSAMEAGVKAFMTTRVADVLMLVGIGYLFVITADVNPGGPTLNFRDIMYNPFAVQGEVHEAAAEAPAAEGEHEGEAAGGEEHEVTTMLDALMDVKAPELFGFISLGSALTLIAVLLIIGTIGKSSQFPLHVWLPDAMEGPTPVSAMIHAATMVSAGVYMIVRMFPLLSAGADFHNFDYNTAMVLMGLVGGFTALGASILAVGQSDIKRILAYSTISQLGYMVAALGIGAWVAAAFHLINHAFFKALLFMASGSVIHAMEHGEHVAHEHGGHDDHHAHEEPDGLVMDYCAPPNDVQRMGGLLHRIPATAITMALGGLSLAGFPLITAGFWSKDEIIAEAWHGAFWNDPFPAFVLLMLLAAAFLTAFYTARMWFLTFWGKPRSDAARYATAGTFRKQWVVFWNRQSFSKDNKLTQEYVSPKDQLSYLQMEFPLMVLAFFAIVAGFIGMHESILGKNALHDFLAPTLAHHPVAIDFNFLPMLVSMIIAVSGLGLGYWLYGRKPLAAGEVDPTEEALGEGVWTMLQNRLYIDMLYRRYLLGFFQGMAEGKGWQLTLDAYATPSGAANLFAERGSALEDEGANKVLAQATAGTAYKVLQWDRTAAWIKVDAPEVDDDQAWVRAEDVVVTDKADKPVDLYEDYTVSFINWVDRGVIDDVLHSIGELFSTLGEAFKRFNTVVIDGVGDGIPQAIGDFAGWFRQTQSGRIQQYLTFVALALLALGTFFIIQVR